MGFSQKMMIKLLRGEIILTIIFALYFLISGQLLVSKTLPIAWFNDRFVQVLLLILLVLALLQPKTEKLLYWHQIGGFIFLPAIVNRYLTSTFGLLCKQNAVWLVLYAALIFPFLLPIITYASSAIKGTLWRLLAVYWLILSIYISNSFPHISPAWADSLISSGLLPAVAFCLAVFLLGSCWGLNLQLVVKQKENHASKLGLQIVLLLAACWLAGFSACIFFALTPSQAILLHPLAGLHLQVSDWFTAIEAGVMEQVEQALVLLVLLAAFRTNRHQLVWSIGLTSLIFSLTHLINLVSGEPTNSVIGQIIFTFGLAAFWLVLWLSTGQLWLAMVMHFFTDLLGLGLQGISFLANYGDPSILGGLIICLTALLLAVIFFIPNKKVMAFNVNKLLKA